MSESHSPNAAAAEHGNSYYLKTWGILCALLTPIPTSQTLCLSLIHFGVHST